MRFYPATAASAALNPQRNKSQPAWDSAELQSDPDLADRCQNVRKGLDERQ